jgi:hypothetical protein
MRNESTPRRPPAFLLAMTVLAIGSLGLGVVNQVGQQSLETAREEDRIASDLSGCARGNVFRQQVIDLGRATDVMITAILDATFSTNEGTSPERAAYVEQFRERLEEPVAVFRGVVDDIHLIDCQAVTPGAQEAP